jgi:hypothetical protein
MLIIRVVTPDASLKATSLLGRTPRMRTSIGMISEETFKDVRVVIAQVFSDDAHFYLWIDGQEILSEPQASIDLIGLHGGPKDLSKGSLQGSHRHTEFGRDPRHPKLRVSVIKRNHMMCKACGCVELFGDCARGNLAPNVSNHCERLVFRARKDGLITPRHDQCTKRIFQIFSDQERTSWAKPS